MTDQDKERPAHYRHRAQQLRAAANAQELGRETRQAMLDLADNYERLADLLEQME